MEPKTEVDIDKEKSWIEHIIGILDNGFVTPEELKTYLDKAIIQFNKGKNG